MELLTTCYHDLRYDTVAPPFPDESDHRPPSFHFSDSRSIIRRTVFSLLCHVKTTYDIHPFLAYLSLNYVDRFLSLHEPLDKQRPWISHILVAASLSLAAKMTAVDLSASLSDLQREQCFEFDASSVERMEKILLATLRWRMRSVTPFSFLPYFISVSEINDLSLSSRVSDIIFNAQQEPMLMEFKPSIISASALLCSIRELAPAAFSSSQALISSCGHVNKAALVECMVAMQEITSEPSDSSTTISVLDGRHTSEEAAKSSRIRSEPSDSQGF